MPIIYAAACRVRAGPHVGAAGAALSAERCEDVVELQLACATALASREISLACRLKERINVFARFLLRE